MTGQDVLTIAERLYVDAVAQLAAADETTHVRSDWEARAMACIDTNQGVTLARGAVEIALNRMKREANDADES
jgi:hypothetical protein